MFRQIPYICTTEVARSFFPSPFRSSRLASRSRLAGRNLRADPCPVSGSRRRCDASDEISTRLLISRSFAASPFVVSRVYRKLSRRCVGHRPIDVRRIATESRKGTSHADRKLETDSALAFDYYPRQSYGLASSNDCRGFIRDVPRK